MDREGNLRQLIQEKILLRRRAFDARMWIALWVFAMRMDPATAPAHVRLSSAAFHERAERFASAYHEVSLAKETLKTSNDAELKRHVDERAAQLAPRVGYRFLDVKVLAEGVTVEQDGVPVPAFEWGHAEPIDPGPHVWTAKLGGVEFWRFEGVASSGAQIQVLPALPYLPPSDDSPN